jgi:hypothetical protein
MRTIENAADPVSRKLRSALRRGIGGFVAFALSFLVLAIGRTRSWIVVEAIGGVGTLVAFAWGFVWSAVSGVIVMKSFRARLRDPEDGPSDSGTRH